MVNFFFWVKFEWFLCIIWQFADRWGTPAPLHPSENRYGFLDYSGAEELWLNLGL